MKYIKKYERLKNPNTEPEVLKLYEYLQNLVKEIKWEFPTNTFYKAFYKDIYIEDNGIWRGWQTYSIILDSYYYFVFQFDYKPDGMWIKYTRDNKIKNEIKKLEIFFNDIAKKHSEWGWCFDREKFMSEDIDMYIKASDYNL